MNKEIKKLTWEYFIEQKVMEVVMFMMMIIGGFIILFAIPIALGTLIGDGYSEFCGLNGGSVSQCGIRETWFEGISYIFLGSTIGFILFLIVMKFNKLIHDWIKSNWEEAEERAKREVRRK